MNIFDISGRVFLVTGATSGIGRGLVDYLLAQGARVAAVGSSESTANKLRAELAEVGDTGSENRSGTTHAATDGIGNREGATNSATDRVACLAADLRDVSQIDPLIERVEAEFGAIDVLVNNAGMGHPMPALEVTPADWDSMMDLNLRAAFFCAQAAARKMLPRGKGRIINMSSQLSLVAGVEEVVYCASKGGLNQITRSLGVEWGSQGVIVTGIAPTFTYTPGTAERLDTPSFRDAVLSKIPRGRFATLNDIGAAVQYLASDASEMANGSTLMVDGGWTAV